MMLWTFGKGQERVTLGRQPDSGAFVVARPDDDTREYHFTDAARLISFQSDMEAFLLKTGWTLLAYSPERRVRRRDRRNFPRLADRRRWWTDPKERAKVVWGGKAANG
jgi:hypothetical protein